MNKELSAKASVTATCPSKISINLTITSQSHGLDYDNVTTQPDVTAAGLAMFLPTFLALQALKKIQEINLNDHVWYV